MMALSFTRLDLLAPPAPRRELLPGLLGAGEVTFLVGDPGAGKSAIAVAMANAIANDGGNVFWVAAEKSAETHRRLGLLDCQKAVFLSAGTIDLAVDGEALREAVAAAGEPALIVIDTWASATLGRDENSVKDVAAPLAAVRELSEAFPGAATLVLHHTGKDRRIRGSTSLAASADAVLQVNRAAQVATVTTMKSNGTATGSKQAYSLVPVEVEGGSVVQAIPMAQAAKAAAPRSLGRYASDLKEALAACNGDLPAARQAFSEKHPDRRHFHRAVADLRERGLIGGGDHEA